MTAPTPQAYSPDVLTSTPGDAGGTPGTSATPKFRRRPASGAAHETRVAWGKKWGAIMRAAAQQLRESEGR